MMLLIQGLAVIAEAGINYIKDAGILHVSDFPAPVPCTPALLLRAERMNGWGVVSHDATRNVYTVDADIFIGKNNGTETLFKIGDNDNPEEILVVKGNVVVHPYSLPGRDARLITGRRRVQTNCLVMGDADNPRVRPTLMIGSTPEVLRSLYVGVVPIDDENIRGRGGVLRVYNALITAYTQDKEHAFGAPGDNRMVYLAGDEIVLSGATISWCAGFMTYGLNNGVVENTTFAHGGTAIVNPRDKIFRGCRFENLDTAVLDWGSLSATFIDCVFTDNACNWSLAYTDSGLTLVDCQYDPPRAGNVLRRRFDARLGRHTAPWVECRRSLVFTVSDQAGMPVTGARVYVQNTQGDTARVSNAPAVTGTDGRTPGRNGDGAAVLLTEYIERAGESRTELMEYSYTVTVKAPGFQETAMENIRPVASWGIVDVIITNQVDL